MFVVSKRNIILPGPNGEKFHMPRDYMGSVPAWAEDSAYLKALADDGKIIISGSGRDRDIDAAAKRGRNKKGKNPPKNPEAPREATAAQPEAPGEEAPDQPEAPAEGSVEGG